MGRITKVHRALNYRITTAGFRAMHYLLLITASLALVTWMPPASAAQGKKAKKSGQGGIEEVVVTAERRPSTVQNTAIAMSAFTGNALQMRQIADTSDLQFDVPNMLFGRSNFTDSNIALRGVSLGTGVYVDQVYLVNPRIFQVQFFDLERVEVLRGPQGTLYGRNTTGGVVNLITAKPTDQFEGRVIVSAGNFKSKNFDGYINVPITDNIASRLALYALRRDGFTRNLYNGHRIDDRHILQARWTTSFKFGDKTDAFLMVQYYRENDHRSRMTKQLCTKDPAGAMGLGCLPGPNSNGFGVVNDQATIQKALMGIVNANAAYAASYGRSLPSYGPAPGYQSAARFTYDYGLKGAFQSALAGVLGAPTAQFLVNDYDARGFNPTVPFVDGFANSINPPDLRKVYADFDPKFYSDQAIDSFELTHHFENFTLKSITAYAHQEFESFTDYDWTVPSEMFTQPITYYIKGEPRIANFDEGVDRSFSRSRQVSEQLTLLSEFDGMFNFTTGLYYLHNSGNGDYNVYSSSLQAYGEAGGINSIVSVLTNGAVPAPPLPQNQIQYDAQTNGSLKTWAAFGEMYFQLNPKAKVTLGLRYTDERISDHNRLIFLDLSAANWLDQANDWKVLTGKLGIDYNADLSFTDQTLLYASYARGFKSGGFNSPPTTPGLYPEYYDPEYVNSFEVGMKNRLLNNTMQANFAFFYYNYDGLQTAQILNQSSVTFNADAKIKGLEAELMFMPGDRWLMGANLALLDASVGNFQSVDPANPTQGAPVVNIFGNVYDAATGQPGNAVLDLTGNELQNAPKYSVNAFMDYTYPLSGGLSLVFHYDYYTQDHYFTRNFDTPRDFVKSWNVSNASVTLNHEGSNDWNLKLWIKNIQDHNNVTSHYVTDGVSGFFTNVVVLSPRTFGLTYTMSF